ncbi:MAG: helix-turn-helix transcriptional regulator [Ilumatobacteraceae bacterium]
MRSFCGSSGSDGRATARETEPVRMAAEGLTNAQIAEQLHLSPLTVKTHINRAMMKLGVRDRAQLVALAYQSGLQQPNRPT